MVVDVVVVDVVVDGRRCRRELYDCLPVISFVAVAAIRGRLYLVKYTEGMDPVSNRAFCLELVIVVIIHVFGLVVVVVINGPSSINQQRMLVKSLAQFPQ